MAAWSRKSWEISAHFLRCLEKRPLTGKFSKILFQRDSPPHRSTCCVQISWNLADGKSVKPCVIYLTKKQQNFASPHALASARICPKPARASPRQCTQNAADFIQIKSVHFRRSYIPTHQHRPRGLESEWNIRLKPSFEPNKSKIPLR